MSSNTPSDSTPSRAECIFVSYRREDAAAQAGRIADRLIARFGLERVFVDIDSIEPGEDFLDAVERSLKASAVMAVVIGPRWHSLTDGNGRRRLDDPEDLVRTEVRRGLEDPSIRVIPILVGGTSMVGRTDLPADIRGLATRNALHVDDGRRFHADVDRLIAAIEGVVPVSAAGPSPVPTAPATLSHPSAKMRPTERRPTVAKTRVFISFDYDHDLDLKNLLVGQAKHSDSPFEIADWSVKDESKTWKDDARKRIRASGVVAVICGDYTDKATGVAIEVTIAQEEKVPYFLLNGHSDKTGKKPTSAKTTDKIYKWTWENLSNHSGIARGRACVR